PKNCRVYIYGTGSAGKSLLMWLKKCREDIVVLGFIDSLKKGRCAGKKVFQVGEFAGHFKKNSYDRVLIASGANRAIAEKLDSLGINRYSIVTVPSYLMENLLPTPLRERFAALKIKFLNLFFKGNIHLFFGEHGGKFIGNNKYYYLYLKEQLADPVYWVVDDMDIFTELKEEGIDVLDYNEKGFTRYLFKAALFYFDNMTWQRKYSYLRFFKAKIIHMSHGVGLKMTEKMLIPREFMEKLSPGEEKRLNEKIFENDLLISTSGFYAQEVSAPAYNTPPERITVSGYPKNDIFYSDIPGSAVFTDKETLDKVRDFKGEKHKIIVYAPTFRDMDSQFKYADIVDYRVFNRFLAANRLVLVIKGHTSAAGEREEAFSHILFYAAHRDGYPLLKEADVLITDYSSIYMDFLHRGKPILFFTYDYREYVENHREIQFDYDKMTPGPKARDYEELTRWLRHFCIENKDGFQKERKEILKLAFKFDSGFASERIFAGMINRYNIMSIGDGKWKKS
ncbi:MAG: hypothetical protein GY950_11430, partial [bacterium]|nr:hypothetical protein [bacterium]